MLKFSAKTVPVHTFTCWPTCRDFLRQLALPLRSSNGLETEGPVSSRHALQVNTKVRGPLPRK
jgi:hypothetical protein